jgi:hypothetical protein
LRPEGQPTDGKSPALLRLAPDPLFQNRTWRWRKQVRLCQRPAGFAWQSSNSDGPLNPLNKIFLVLAHKFMFANPHNPPTGAPQCRRYQTVAHFVAGKFIVPECAVALRLRRVLGTAVPETAVNEDCEVELWKDEIRYSKHGLIAPPADDFVPTK